MQPERLLNLNGVPVLEYGPAGPTLLSSQGALDVIGHALGSEAEWVILPITRLAPEFFDLSSGLAGDTVQKFVNYRVSFVVLGDVSARMAERAALRAFIHEANLGKVLWFLNSAQEFEQRLLGR